MQDDGWSLYDPGHLAAKLGLNASSWARGPEGRCLKVLNHLKDLKTHQTTVSSTLMHFCTIWGKEFERSLVQLGNLLLFCCFRKLHQHQRSWHIMEILQLLRCSFYSVWMSLERLFEPNPNNPAVGNMMKSQTLSGVPVIDSPFVPGWVWLDQAVPGRLVPWI